MKKNLWTKMVSLVLVLVCVASLAACGGGSGDAAGTYTLQTLEMAGMTMDYEQLMATYGDGQDVDIKLVLNEDGTFQLDMEAVAPGTSMDGTWKASGSKVTLTIEEGDVEASLKNGVITMSDSGISMTFKKK